MWLKCILGPSDNALTVGKNYEARGVYANVGHWILNNNNEMKVYPSTWFVKLSDDVPFVQKPKFISNRYNKNCISFDFDGTLVSMVLNEGRTWIRNNGKDVRTWNLHVLKKVVTAKRLGFVTAIVTERANQDVLEVVEFKLRAEKAFEGFKIDKVIPTARKNKGHILENIGSVMHWDDNFKNAEDPDGEFKGIWIKVKHPSDVNIIPSPLISVESTVPEKHLLPQALQV